MVFLTRNYSESLIDAINFLANLNIPPIFIAYKHHKLTAVTLALKIMYFLSCMSKFISAVENDEKLTVHSIIKKVFAFV